MTKIKMISTCTIAMGLLFSAAHADAQAPTGRFEIPKSMKIEHEELHTDLARLMGAGGWTGEAAAKAEGKPDGVRFAEMLTAHAQGEEQITYPTARLIGLYVKSKAAQCAK